MKKHAKALAMLLTVVALALLTACNPAPKEDGLDTAKLMMTVIYEGSDKNSMIVVTNVGDKVGSLDGYELSIQGNKKENRIQLKGTLDAGASLFVTHPDFYYEGIAKLSKTDISTTHKMLSSKMALPGYTKNKVDLVLFDEVVDTAENLDREYFHLRTYSATPDKTTPWQSIKSGIIEEKFKAWKNVADYKYADDAEVYVFAGKDLVKAGTPKNVKLYHNQVITYSWISRAAIDTDAVKYETSIENKITVNGADYSCNVTRPSTLEYKELTADSIPLVDGKDGLKVWTDAMNPVDKDGNPVKLSENGTFPEGSTITGVVTAQSWVKGVNYVYIQSGKDVALIYGNYTDKKVPHAGDIVTIPVKTWKNYYETLEIVSPKTDGKYEDFTATFHENPTPTVYYTDVTADNWNKAGQIDGKIPLFVRATGTLKYDVQGKSSNKVVLADGKTEIDVYFDNYYDPQLLNYKKGDKVSVYGHVAFHEKDIQIKVIDTMHGIEKIN